MEYSHDCFLKQIAESLYRIHGQNIADIVHYQVGTAIQSIFWNSENICVLEKGRFGIFLESGWDRDALEVCVELLRERLKTPVSINRLEVQVSPSFGLAVPEAIPDEPEVFIQYAETACEYGIRNHMGTVVVPFETRMQAEKEYQGRIEHCKKRAVENGEFSLVYQPQYSRNPEKDPVGYEALIRWNNKELGNVSPAVFIPLAEAEGQITGIGEYVINETCRFIRTYLDTWQKPVRIAVNASFLELMDSHYIERLMGYVNQYGLKPEMLSIEITETAISKYLDAVIDNLRSLREHGFEIHLDDFGTGYSSLNHLGRLPVNLLKIDRSFVWELEESTRMRELTDLIIKVAHQLDMEVCAEGVETEAQFSLLRDMGCDIFQGFLLSKPRSGERLLELAGTH